MEADPATGMQARHCKAKIEAGASFDLCIYMFLEARRRSTHRDSRERDLALAARASLQAPRERARTLACCAGFNRPLCGACHAPAMGLLQCGSTTPPSSIPPLSSRPPCRPAPSMDHTAHSIPLPHLTRSSHPRSSPLSRGALRVFEGRFQLSPGASVRRSENGLQPPSPP